MNRLFLALAGLVFSLPASAFRSAVFDPSLEHQSLLWTQQKEFFAKETPSSQKRPIWVHAGDSLASGWASQHDFQTLMERAKNPDKELADPGSFEDLAELLPSTALTWYAGIDLKKGFLGRLERSGSTFEEWIVLSTALAGARITPELDEDGLGPLLEITQPSRVRLVTLSLGGNDVCQNLQVDPGALAQRLTAVKAHLPNAKWVVWDLPDPISVYARIQAEIAQIADPLVRRRIGAYCEKSWKELQCPALQSHPDRMPQNREQIRGTFEKHFGPLWRAESLLEGTSILDALGRDCFHPGPKTQKRIAEELPL
jgi:lysophospholipase L1-like esterase